MNTLGLDFVHILNNKKKKKYVDDVRTYCLRRYYY